MATFDDPLNELARYLGELRAGGRDVREFRLPASAAELSAGMPVKVGPGANPGIVLRSDTFVELGSPAAGSCAFMLWTDDPARIDDGKVTLIGPDIPESAGASLPFAQVLSVGGREIGPEQHPALEQAQYVADQIEGYMVKTATRNMWGRVSKEVADKGFDFATLGRALMCVLKSAVPAVEAMEVVFITSSKQDVLGLDPIAADVRQIANTVVKEHWKARGYDLDCDLGCATCDDKGVCDDIRDVLGTIRKNLQKSSARQASS